jgi:hypothetical protein
MNIPFTVCERFTIAAVGKNDSKFPEPDERASRTEFPSDRSWIVEVHHAGMVLQQSGTVNSQGSDGFEDRYTGLVTAAFKIYLGAARW